MENYNCCKIIHLKKEEKVPCLKTEIYSFNDFSWRVPVKNIVNESFGNYVVNSSLTPIQNGYKKLNIPDKSIFYIDKTFMVYGGQNKATFELYLCWQGLDSSSHYVRHEKLIQRIPAVYNLRSAVAPDSEPDSVFDVAPTSSEASNTVGLLQSSNNDSIEILLDKELYDYYFEIRIISPDEIDIPNYLYWIKFKYLDQNC